MTFADLGTLNQTLPKAKAWAILSHYLAHTPVPLDEKPEAVENLAAILEIADGVMVARGDLGIEVPMEQLPIIQKDIVRKCIQRARPVIVATQMMESMIQNPTPTRAEANDVANAVLDGTDAVMLSGETAVGEYPIEAIRSMASVCIGAEKYPDHSGRMGHRSDDKFELVDEAIAACREAVRLDPDLAPAHHFLGNALRAKGRPDEAMKEHRDRGQELDLRTTSLEAAAFGAQVRLVPNPFTGTAWLSFPNP